jgi:hypothetical protein
VLIRQPGQMLKLFAVIAKFLRTTWTTLTLHVTSIVAHLATPVLALGKTKAIPALFKALKIVSIILEDTPVMPFVPVKR